MRSETSIQLRDRLLQRAAIESLTPEIPPGLPQAVHEAMVQRLCESRLNIPMLPEVAMQLMNKPFNEDSDVQELGELIYRDQMLAVQILRAANSAALGVEREVQSIAEAISRLGLNALRELVVAVTLKSRIFSIPEYDFILRKYWRTSATAAAYAKEIARHGRSNAELTFICGLLHNIGQPVTLLALVDIQNELRQVLPRPMLLRAVPYYERSVTSLLLEKWSLPPQLSAAILFHGDPVAAAQSGFECEVTCISALFADYAGRPRPALEQAIREHPVCVNLRLSPEKMEALFAYQQAALKFASCFG